MITFPVNVSRIYQSGISVVILNSHCFSKQISNRSLSKFKFFIIFLTILLNLFPRITPFVPAGINSNK